MKILGIDPGRQGALAIMDTDGPTVETYDMPDTTLGLHNLICSLPVVAFCVLEKPFYPQMIGVSNAVKIAEAFGVLKGALAWKSIPVREVRPNEWKPALGLSTDKAASRAKADELFPGFCDQWARKKDDGRAEAALLAWYGLRFATRGVVS